MFYKTRNAPSFICSACALCLAVKVSFWVLSHSTVTFLPKLNYFD